MKSLLGRQFLIFVSFLLSSAQAQQAINGKRYEIPPIEKSFESFGSSNAEELDPQSIKVFIWNLYKGAREEWSDDYPVLAKPADLLLLQEVYLNESMKNVLLNTSFEYNFGVSFLYKNDEDTPTGTAIGSRVTPIHPYFLRTKDREPIIKTPKTITYAYFPIKGFSEKLLVLNIHGLNITSDKKLKNQIKDTEKIIQNHKGPIIFAGDFNTRTKKRLRQTRHFMKKHGLTEILFPGKERKAFAGNILDLAFSRGLEVVFEDVFEDIESSDHKAMWVTFKVPKT